MPNDSRSARSGRFVSKAVVEAAIQHADADGSGDPAGSEPPVRLEDLQIKVPRKPRTGVSDAFGKRAKAKIDRLAKDLEAERLRSKQLAEAIEANRLAHATAMNQHEAKLKALEPELALMKRNLRDTKFELIAARAKGRAQAAGAVDRVRAKANAKLQDERVEREKAVARLKDEARQQREDARQTALQLSKALAIKQKEQQQAKENSEQLISAVELKLTESRTREAEQEQLLTQKHQELQGLIKGEAQLKRQQALLKKKLSNKASSSSQAPHREGKQLVQRQPVKTSVPPISEDSDVSEKRRRYDYIRNQSLRLKAHFTDLYLDGPCGETVLETLTYFLDHNLKFAADLFLELELPQAIEQEVVTALQSWWTPEKAAALRHQTGMTWDGYRLLSSSYMKARDVETMKKVDIELPYGNSPPQMPKTWKVWKYESELVEAFGLTESEDGLAAWVDVIKVLELRLNAIDEQSIPARIKIFFGADAFRLYKQNSVKAVMCVVRPMVERRDNDGRRLQGWNIQSVDNCVKLALYEGSDSYLELCTKGSQVQIQLQKLRTSGLLVHSIPRSIHLGLFGDLSFLASVLGSCGLSSNHPCVGCDVHKDHLAKTEEEFIALGLPLPQAMTRLRRNKLSHSFGEEYGITEPYECEGCKLLINEHGQHPPQTKAQISAYYAQHFGQVHGRPPLQQVESEDVIACSMHGRHNIRGNTWYATVGQNLYSAAKVKEVNRILAEDWKMKRHTVKPVDAKKGPLKDAAIVFNGPEGEMVDKRINEVLDVVDANRIVADELWRVQAELFECYRTVEYDPSKWSDLAEKAKKLAIDYRDIFISLTSANDVIVSMHYAIWHWPQNIKDHGSLCHTDAQSLEASNQEAKNFGRKRSSRQTKYTTKTGLRTRGRMAQSMARFVSKQVHLVKDSRSKESKKHIKKLE